MQVTRTGCCLTCAAVVVLIILFVDISQMLQKSLHEFFRDANFTTFAVSFLANLCVYPTAAEAVKQTELVPVVWR